MMVYEFSTDVREEAMRLLAAEDLCAVIYELDVWLRGEIKYSNRNDLRETRDKLTQIMQDHGVDLEQIYT